jgi:hypothetical protein
MGIGKVGAFVMVALVSAVVTFFVVRLGGGDAQRCDIHPHLSARGFAALKSNLERARRTAHDAALADKKDGDEANRAGEAAALDSFVYDLRDAVAAEYTRHRQALDSCF